VRLDILGRVRNRERVAAGTLNTDFGAPANRGLVDPGGFKDTRVHEVADEGCDKIGLWGCEKSQTDAIWTATSQTEWRRPFADHDFN
jgi:hypothetical protein